MFQTLLRMLQTCSFIIFRDLFYSTIFAHANKKRKRKMLFMLQIYPTTQTVPDLRPTIFGFAVFHNLLVCLHLFFLGCIVSYLGLIECWA